MAQEPKSSSPKITSPNSSDDPSQDQGPPQIHLHQMDISSQLRSLSQLSSDFDNPQDQDPRPSLTRVRSPATSSIYSRPCSATESADLNSHFEIPHDLETTLASWPNWGDEEVVGPLRDLSIESAKNSKRAPSPLPLPPSLPRNSRIKSRNSSPASLSTLSSTTRGRGFGTWLRPSLRMKSPQSKRSASVLTTTTTTTTTTGRASRLFPRNPWTAAKKLQKRQSLAKFLRGVGRRTQESPNLTCSFPIPQATSHHHHNSPVLFFDGPTDDPALLDVNNYELEDLQPSSSRKHRFRSASVSQLRPVLRPDTASAGRALLLSEATQRDKTLEEYERALTSVGDDRRRPSGVNLRFCKARTEGEEDAGGEDMEEEGGAEDGTQPSRRPSRATLAAALKPQRRLSRAHPLHDPANPLMASALEKHQQEKALFRSASKQKEAAAAARASEGNLASKSSASASDLVDVQRHRLLLREPDPHQQPRKKGLEVLGLSTPDSRERRTVRSRSLGFLIPAYSRAEALLSRGRESTKTASAAPADNGEDPALDPSSSGPSTFGPVLAPSWSRFPSHSRVTRSGSAGQDDAVFVRDFGAASGHDARGDRTDSDATGDIEPRGRRDGFFSPRLRAAKREEGEGKKRKGGATVRKSRSLMFSGIVRYYSNLLHTSGFTGQNRRSSVAVGSRVEHPELEMLAGYGG